uniref:Uncharacterized protein n=1 Tax=Arundo donax TaxID=35708 RepID=A0A0A8XQL8_ARUDO
MMSAARRMFRINVVFRTHGALKHATYIHLFATSHTQKWNPVFWILINFK